MKTSSSLGQILNFGHFQVVEQLIPRPKTTKISYIISQKSPKFGIWLGRHMWMPSYSSAFCLSLSPTASKSVTACLLPSLPSLPHVHSALADGAVVSNDFHVRVRIFFRPAVSHFYEKFRDKFCLQLRRSLNNLFEKNLFRHNMDCAFHPVCLSQGFKDLWAPFSGFFKFHQFLNPSQFYCVSFSEHTQREREREREREGSLPSFHPPFPG